jgi:hypothetical protein
MGPLDLTNGTAASRILSQSKSASKNSVADTLRSEISSAADFVANCLATFRFEQVFYVQSLFDNKKSCRP